MTNKSVIRPATSNQDVMRKIDYTSKITQQAVRKAFFVIGHQLVKTAKEQVLKAPKTGRIYRIKRGKRYKNHQASAAGESPANLSGELRKSIGFEIKGSEQLEFGSGRGGVKYARYLEEGTKKMAPRPLLGNAFAAEQSQIQQIFSNEIQKALK